LNYHVKKYGCVAAIKVVNLEDDIILIASDGIIIRIQASSIRECARPSKGVLLMRVGEGSKVVTLARTAHEEDEQEDTLPPDDGDADEGADQDEETEE
jgi:DNA gyrase subunit A